MEIIVGEKFIVIGSGSILRDVVEITFSVLIVFICFAKVKQLIKWNVLSEQ